MRRVPTPYSPFPTLRSSFLTRVIALARADVESGAGHADFDRAPFAVALLVGGFIGERVLAAQLLDRSGESVAHSGAAGSSYESAAGLGREHFHHIGAVVFPLRLVDGAVAHVDGVDQGVRVQSFACRHVERGFTLGVGAVGDHDDGATPFGALREGLGGFDYGVVKRRLVASFHVPDGLRRVARLAKILQHFYFVTAKAVYSDH